MSSNGPDSNPDFRSAAAEATVARLNHSPGLSLADVGESGCVPIPGGRRVQCLLELTTLCLSMVCLLSSFLVLPLSWFGIIRLGIALPILLVGLVVSLVFRKIKSLILRMHLASRPDGFLKTFAHLPSVAVAIEDGRTQRKTKLVPEDDCICVLDAEQRRLLIEGCCYRYVVRVKDVSSVEPVSGYALSGARLVCRMSGHLVDLGLTSAGQGPLASLTQAFAPSALAAGRSLGFTCANDASSPALGSRP